MNLRRLAAVARKESLHLLRDWRSLTLALAIPLILVLLYGYALTLDLRQVPTIVWDQSRTATSRDFLSLLQSSPYFAIQAYGDTYDDLEEELDRGRAMIAIVIPADFAAKVLAGKPARIQIIGDGSDANTSRLSMNYANAVGAIFARTIAAEQMEFKGKGQLRPPVEMIQAMCLRPEILRGFATALAIDPAARPETRLVNLVVQRRARHLLAQADADDVLIPFVDAYVDRVDRAQRVIHVDWDPSY